MYQGKEWGFDFLGKFLVKFPTLGIEIWVQLNQISPPTVGRFQVNLLMYLWIINGPRGAETQVKFPSGDHKNDEMPHICPPPPSGLTLIGALTL